MLPSSSPFVYAGPHFRARPLFDSLNKLEAASTPVSVLVCCSLQDERTFSEEEEEKLQAVLQLQLPDLQLVVEACEFFLHQVPLSRD